MAGVKTEITRLTLTIDSEEAIHNLPEAEENRCRLHFEKEYARKIKRQQEEKMELKWGIVAGEVGRCMRRKRGKDFRWHTCMGVLRLMRFIREDKALVAAVRMRGTVVAIEDNRDALAQVVALLQECMVTSSWRGCMVGSYEIDRLIESSVDEVKEKESRVIEDVSKEDHMIRYDWKIDYGCKGRGRSRTKKEKERKMP